MHPDFPASDAVTARRRILLVGNNAAARHMQQELELDGFEVVTLTGSGETAPSPRSVASILEDDLEATIQFWMGLVEKDGELPGIHLSFQERTRHLPQLFRDLICRLRLPALTTASVSIAARDHGMRRRQQGYTAAMVVEESRILEISIFTTLQKNLRTVDATQVLQDVITIADECDSQLKQAVLGYGEPETTWSAA